MAKSSGTQVGISGVPTRLHRRAWTAAQRAVIRGGHPAWDMDDKWHAALDGDWLYVLCSWTGLGGTRHGSPSPAAAGRICEAVVTGDIGKYRRGSDEYESLMLEWVIGGVLLGEWHGELWLCSQQHRP